MAQSYYANIKSAGVTPSGIIYQRVLPLQRTSYRTGDIGWHVQNGTFDYSGDITCGLYKQELDLTAGVDYFYTLKHNNAFGNKNRFTTSIGTPASDGKSVFIPADFTGAINGYVIDHLTGMGYDILSNTNFGTSGTSTGWNGAVDEGVASTFGGYTDWFMLGIEHYYSVVSTAISAYGTGNIFRYADLNGTPGLAYNFIYTSATVPGVTTQASTVRQVNRSIENANKTGFLQIGALYGRNHY
jgi:hypothetical protein